MPRDSAPRPQLSALELACLRLLAEGLSERQAAEQLHYSYQHIRRTVKAAVGKLGGSNTRQALYLAGRWKLF